MSLGAKVNDFEAAEMSQQEVADALGITRGGVSMLERNAFRKIRSAIAQHPIGCGCDFCEMARRKTK